MSCLPTDPTKQIKLNTLFEWKNDSVQSEMDPKRQWV
jgi:hypothetical protein